MIIGCVSLVKIDDDKFVSIICSKGRGRILPGGKWEKGETFKQCAARELSEETGLIATYQKYIFAGFSTDGAYVYAFLTGIKEFAPVDSAEGRVVLSSWADLFTSEFRAYYEILRDHGRHAGHF